MRLSDLRPHNAKAIAAAAPRYAHLSPAFLSAEVSLLDPPPPTPPPAPSGSGNGPDGNSAETEVPDFVKEGGSPYWTIFATGWGWAWRPAKRNENRWDWTECGAGSGEIEMNHGAIEAEQLCD